jgi:Kef-type K+ transport system membrane component KefB
MLMSTEAHDKWGEAIDLLTNLCLSFIMINVGYEFDIDKSNVKNYAKDYLVASCAAGLPWIFVATWFVHALPGSMPWSGAMLIACFAAPTSAGILFSMLEAAGLKETWLFKKARILAVLDDIATLLLMVPLKLLMVGFEWHMVGDMVIIVMLLSVAWKKLHSIVLPQSCLWTMLYAVAVTAACELVRRATWEHIKVEVLLPAFTLGCVMHLQPTDSNCEDTESSEEVSEIKDPQEEQIKSVTSAMFMLLVGLSMPSLLNTGGGHLTPCTMVLHVLAVTVFMTVGKMFPLFCYSDEADFSSRFALCMGMCPRGEVGAGVIVIALKMGIKGPAVPLAVASLAFNLMLSTGFVTSAQRWAKPTPPKLPALGSHRRPVMAIFLAVFIPVIIVANSFFISSTGDKVPGAAMSVVLVVVTTWLFARRNVLWTKTPEVRGQPPSPLVVVRV